MTETLLEILANYPAERDADLLAILEDIQDELGYLTQEAIDAVGQYLNVPASKVYGVANYYDRFNVSAPACYQIQLCKGGACYALGATSLLGGLQDALGINAGETTADGLFSLQVVSCIGACGLAPVMMVNGKLHQDLSAESISEILDSYRQRAQN